MIVRPIVKVFYREDEKVIHILKEKYGVTYLVFKGEVDITKSFPFEASQEGRCLGFDVPQGLDLQEFDAELRRFAQEKGLIITGERK